MNLQFYRAPGVFLALWCVLSTGVGNAFAAEVARPTPATSATPAAAPNASPPAVVQLGTADAVFEKTHVMITLAHGLERDAKARQFRVSWGYGAAGGSTDGTLLYDRDRGTVKYCLRDSSEWGNKTTITLYRKVTDAIIRKIGKGFEDDINDDASPSADYYLERLTLHGCTRTVVAQRFNRWTKQ